MRRANGAAAAGTLAGSSCWSKTHAGRSTAGLLLANGAALKRRAAAETEVLLQGGDGKQMGAWRPRAGGAGGDRRGGSAFFFSLYGQVKEAARDVSNRLGLGLNLS